MKNMPLPEKIAWGGGLTMAFLLLCSFVTLAQLLERNKRLETEVEWARRLQVQHVIDLTKCQEDLKHAKE